MMMMMEIDIAKATTLKPLYDTDDADIYEADTALNTPTTGSLTDAFVKRFSSTSSTQSFRSYGKRLSSITKSPEVQHLQSRIQALESDIQQFVLSEASLKSQLLILEQQQKDVKDPTPLKRMSQHIQRFLTHQQTAASLMDMPPLENMKGSELPGLFDSREEEEEEESDDEEAFDGNWNIVGSMNDIPSILIFRLKAMVDNFVNTADTDPISFCTDLVHTLDAWQGYQCHHVQKQQAYKKQEQDRITRLLDALHKSLLKNKFMQRDIQMLEKQFKSDMKHLMQEKQSVTAKEKSAFSHETCDQTKRMLECQLQNLEMAFKTCQDDRDDYETTLEMVRREMETMLEELEDTRQQRLRYKTQASRLRTGLEAIQKKRKHKEEDNNNNAEESDNDDEQSCCSSEEDEATEAIRLMYNEAERQAVDLDRECKRQTLTLNSIRKELKLTEERYQSAKTEKNKQINQLDQENRKLTRRVEILELQLRQQQQQQTVNEATLGSNEESHEDTYSGKIHALQIALKAAKADAVVQHTRIYQLEQQSKIDLSQHISQIQDMFKKELDAAVKTNDCTVNKALADRIEFEQREWRHSQKKHYQKKHDVDLLRVHREIRVLSGRLQELESDAELIKSRHTEEMTLQRHLINTDFERKLQTLIAHQQSREQDLQDQVEVLFQKNQTMQDESLILYGRNMMMAHELGKVYSNNKKTTYTL